MVVVIGFLLLLVGFIAGYLVCKKLTSRPTGVIPHQPLHLQVPSHDEREKKIDPADLKKHLETPRKELKHLEGKGKNLIVVAYRLPVSCVRTEDGDWKVTWDDARNFLSNLRILKSMTVKWVGYPGFDVPKPERENFDKALAKHNCVAVHLGTQLNNDFYEGFCKSILWPVFHYVLPHGDGEWGKRWDHLWQAFQRANMMYRKVVESLAESPTDTIWIQNYHLLLLPSLLRKHLARARIGIFIHTPWPSSDVFRILPLRDTLLRGVMGADLVGFHTYDYARHFLSVCKRVLEINFKPSDGGSLGVEYSGRFVSILISHVGVDSKTFATLARAPDVRGRADDIRAKYNNRSLIIGVDDLDQVKCSTLKLQAYSRFLNNHEDLREKVVLVQVVLPSSSNPVSRDLVRSSMLQEAKNIKENYGEHCLDLIEKDKLDLKELVALYSASNVAFVSTFWDGLNLAPFEYTATQDPTQPGVLILSEFMGCSRSLSGVLRVNPWNLETVSEAIYSSLTMPIPERIANHKRRSKYVMEHTLEKWAYGYLEALDLATRGADDLTFVRVGFGSNVRLIGLRNDFARLEESTVVSAYRHARRARVPRILLFDYDGTLTGEEPDDKSHAVRGPSSEVLEWLKILTEDPLNTVFILSGRKRAILYKWFGHLTELGLAAEKGCFLRWPKARANLYRLDLHNDKQFLQPGTRPRSSSSPSIHATPIKQSPGSQSVPNSVMKQLPHQLSFTLGSTDRDRKLDDSGKESKYEGEEVGSTSTSTSSSLGTLEEHMDASEWEVVCPVDNFVWKEIAMEVLRSYTRRTDGSFIEDKEFGIVWHFENADPEYGRMQADEVAKYLKGVMKNPTIDVVLYDFHRILEVKPIGVSKGSAASRILQQVLGLSASASLPAASSLTTPSSSSPSTPSTSGRRLERKDETKKECKELPLLLCIGDDKSDEDMFVALETTSDLLKGLSGDTKHRSEPDDAPHSPLGLDTGGNLPPSSSGYLSSHHRVTTFTCCVGIKPSAARYYLQDDGEVRQLLQAIAEAHRGGSGGTTPITGSPATTSDSLDDGSQSFPTTSEGSFGSEAAEDEMVENFQTSSGGLRKSRGRGGFVDVN